MLINILYSKLTISLDFGGVEVVGSQQRELARVVVGHFGEQDSGRVVESSGTVGGVALEDCIKGEDFEDANI